MHKNIIFHVNGGFGKNIAATAVATAIKMQFPEWRLIVVSFWPGVWIHNPDIYRVQPGGNAAYFYTDFINGPTVSDCKVFHFEPYFHARYLRKEIHLIEAWAEMCQVPYRGEKPTLYLSHSEIQRISNEFKDVDVFLIQTNGGGPDQQHKYSWCRDIPIHQAQEVVEAMRSSGLQPVHLRREDLLQLQNVPFYQTQGIRDLLALVYISKKRLFIDSFAQHAAASFGMKSVVCWPIDNTKRLGYEFHDNVVCDRKDLMTEHLIDSMYGDVNIAGTPHESIFTDDKVFNVTELVERLKDEPQSALSAVENKTTETVP